MSISSELAQERSDGLYQSVEDNLICMGSLFLGGSKFGIDFVRHVEQWSGNYSYKDSKGGDFKINIIGEIAPTNAGTIIAAKGNHYVGRPGDPKAKILGDDAKVKDVLSITVPTGCPRCLSTLFNNQLATLNAIRAADEKDKPQEDGTVYVRGWVRNAAGDDISKKDHIVVHMLPKYGNPDRGRFIMGNAKKRTISESDSDSVNTLPSDDQSAVK
ncbi:hypothetical protein C0992_007913, partial [Termitomyces sp. T32_za158]